MGKNSDPGYVDLRLPDGTHSGVRIDRGRGLIEVQKRGVKYLFDLLLTLDAAEQPCYTSDSNNAAEHCHQ